MYGQLRHNMKYLNKVCLRRIFFLVVLIMYSISDAFSQETAKDLYNRGYRYLSVDREKAIELLNQSISKDSTFADAYFHRGVTYFKLDNFDKALKDFDMAFLLNPNLSILWMYKGFAYRNKGMLNEALDSFSNYISLHPQDTSAYSYILRGKVKYELGDFNGAITDYDMAVKLKPFEEKYNYYRFVAFYEAKQLKQALACVNNLIKVNPDFYGYYFYKGNVFHEMQYYDSAVFMYNVSIIKNYQNADGYFYRAQSYEKLGKLDRALEDYNTAIVMNNEDGSYYSKRGHCKLQLGNKLGACEDWNEAGNLGYYEDFNKVKDVCP